VTIADVESKEGKRGTTSFRFVVSLSASPVAPVTVAYASAAGTATSPADFAAVSGVLTFPVGTTSQAVTVSVVSDTVRERNEVFYVNLSNPSPNAYIDRSQAVGTIVNDD
jgi:Calx-beta domain